VLGQKYRLRQVVYTFLFFKKKQCFHRFFRNFLCSFVVMTRTSFFSESGKKWNIIFDLQLTVAVYILRKTGGRECIAEKMRKIRTC